MSGNHSSRDFLLGLLFFGSIALLLYLTIALTGFSLRERTHMEVWFANARGLKTGDAVLVSGRVTGSVRAVEFFDDRPEDRRIRVELEFEEPVTLHQDYLIVISEFTLLGGRVVEIDPGSAAEPVLAPGAELLGNVGVSALEALGDLVTENRENLRVAIANLRQATDDINSGKGILGALIHDESLRTNLDGFMTDVRAMASDIREGKGILGMLINDPAKRDEMAQLLSSAAKASTDLSAIAEDLRQGQGMLGALLTDESLAAQGRELVANLDTTSEALRTMVLDAQKGQGLIGRLIADETMAEEARAFIDNLAEVTRRLKDGEGSLGRILAQDEAYDELLHALRTLNAELEDVREAEPVSSFTRLLFGAF